jgi:hypothetical protein
MTKYSFSNPNWTPTAVADAATMTANGAGFLQGGTATMYYKVSEVSISGQGSASTVQPMIIARDSTVAATAITLGTNGKNAPLDVLSTALSTVPVPGFSATTMPQRSATLSLLQLTLNGFGGIYRWVAYPGEEITIYGTAVSVGEISISQSNLVGAVGPIADHIVYEPS